MPATLSGVLTAVLVCIAAWSDLRWRRIPNWATYAAVLWGLLLNACVSRTGFPSAADQLGAIGFLPSLLGAVAMFVGGVLVFGSTGGGAGDVKLLVALGALLGLDAAIDAVLYSFIAAGAASVSWALWQFGLLKVIGASLRAAGSFVLPQWIDRPRPEQQHLLRMPIPLAPFFAAGTLLVLAGFPLSRWSHLGRF
jgi:prepilin peptidase CpaA